MSSHRRKREREAHDDKRETSEKREHMSGGIQRRDFLRVVGASGAGATMFGCSTENVEKLIPYVVPPEEITPGVATWYASVCGECPAGCGVWVRTREGRAVKIEGNPEHPVSGGALCARGHSALQGLYNPDRLTGPMVRDGDGFAPVSWEDAEAQLVERLGAAGGNVLLVTGSDGGALGHLFDGFAEATGGTRVEYEALSEAPLRAAARIAFGRDVVPAYDFEAARFVLSFGADFLETWLSPTAYGRGFARTSAIDPMGSKGRFVFVGPRLSLTGQNADEWFPIRAGSEAAVALAMAAVIAGDGADAGPYGELLAGFDLDAAANAAGLSTDEIADLARRFVAEGPGLALGPGVSGQHRGATGANLAVLVLNHVAGNIGRSVHLASPDQAAASPSYASLESAIGSMRAGEVSVALVHGANPAYSLPPAAGFVEAFGAVPFKVSFASALDETAHLADLVLPDTHPLESWGDSHPRPGVHALQQPVMRPVPLFDARATGDVLLSAANALGQNLGAGDFQGYVRARWQEMGLAGDDDFDGFWREALRRGVVLSETDGEADAAELLAPDPAVGFDVPSLDGDEDGLALVVYPSSRFGDGRQANRSWMQELPDPVSKITWHSWLELHPTTAERHGLREGDVVRVSSPHGQVELPVWPYAGVREDVAAIAMGSGHTGYGRYADGNGVNPMALLPAESEQPSGGMVHLATRVAVEPTGEWRKLASIHGSGHTQEDRNIAPAVAIADVGHAEEEHDEHALYELQEVGGFVPVPADGEPGDFPLPGARHGEYDPETTPRWAMAIDLDKCTGCSACVTACQAENNVPVVGEQELLMGRDIQWMRIENYFETVDASHAGPVDVRFTPMLCQHCGNAPCEPVCPVFAAYHTPDGLNAQVYNRCVGTRYCANNCPYKVRVFNWYEYSDVPEPLNWQYNPDVTVRGEGVMEKCTFCVQRIRDVENRAVLEGRAVPDGEVVTACQQSCPAEAIVFGNIRDPNSRVAQVTASERSYRVLDDLINTQPAVTYQRKVTFHEPAAAGH
ncbi:MAG: 4Fe-4S dicluster domain-containing protein [Gammaproteobacteria bacterium]|nr:4Fe-4S dicluster domain-containing protein [Gammaproteobacteria bacterium]